MHKKFQKIEKNIAMKKQKNKTKNDDKYKDLHVIENFELNNLPTIIFRY